MAFIPDPTRPVMLGLCGVLALLGCSDDQPSDDDVGESSTESTGESESAESSDDASSSTDSDSTGSTDATDEAEGETTGTTDTDSSSTDSTETDTTETGDPSCEDDLYTGTALADDPWGLGDLCDEIWVCADEDQVPLILAAVPEAMCEPNNGCPVSHCTINYGGIVDEAILADVCAALLVPGIDEAFCVVFGP